MLMPSSTGHQTNFFGTDLLLQLDPRDPLLRLTQVIPWPELDSAFAKHYAQGLGRPSKPIRLMVGLLILKQMDNLSDEQVVLNCKRNPYYQAFCGLTEFSNKLPCDSTELVHFRKRIGTEGVDRIFQMSQAARQGRPGGHRQHRHHRPGKKHHLPHRCQTSDQDHQPPEQAGQTPGHPATAHLR